MRPDAARPDAAHTDAAHTDAAHTGAEAHGRGCRGPPGPGPGGPLRLCGAFPARRYGVAPVTLATTTEPVPSTAPWSDTTRISPKS